MDSKSKGAWCRYDQYPCQWCQFIYDISSRVALDGVVTGIGSPIYGSVTECFHDQKGETYTVYIQARNEIGMGIIKDKLNFMYRVLFGAESEVCGNYGFTIFLEDAAKSFPQSSGAIANAE